MSAMGTVSFCIGNIKAGLFIHRSVSSDIMKIVMLLINAAITDGDANVHSAKARGRVCCLQSSRASRRQAKVDLLRRVRASLWPPKPVEGQKGHRARLDEFNRKVMKQICN